MVNRTNFHSSSQFYFTVHIFCDAKISKFMESFDETPIVGMTGEACTMLAHVIVGIAMDTVELSAKLSVSFKRNKRAKNSRPLQRRDATETQTFPLQVSKAIEQPLVRKVQKAEHTHQLRDGKKEEKAKWNIKSIY